MACLSRCPLLQLTLAVVVPTVCAQPSRPLHNGQLAARKPPGLNHHHLHDTGHAQLTNNLLPYDTCRSNRMQHLAHEPARALGDLPLVHKELHQQQQWTAMTGLDRGQMALRQRRCTGASLTADLGSEDKLWGASEYREYFLDRVYPKQRRKPRD